MLLQRLFMLASILIIRAESRSFFLQKQRLSLNNTESVAVVWVFTNELPYNFNFIAATLLNHKLSINLNILVLVPVIPEHFLNQKTDMWNKIKFHKVTLDMWKQRVFEKLGVLLRYNFESNPKKIGIKDFLSIISFYYFSFQIFYHLTHIFIYVSLMLQLI